MVRNDPIRRSAAFTIVALFLALVVSQAAAASTSVSLNVASNDPDGIAKVLIGGAMASFFGLDSQVSVGITAQSSGGQVRVTPNAQVSVPLGSSGPSVRPGGDPFDDLPVWYISSNTGTAPNRIVEMRRQGRSWVDVATYYRLPEEWRGKWVVVREGKGRQIRERRVFVRYTDSEFERVVRIRFINEYYGVPTTTVNIWLNQGYSTQDIIIISNLAGRAHTKPEVIMDYRRRGYSWERIADQCKVPRSAITQPMAPSRRPKYKVKWEREDGKRRQDDHQKPWGQDER